MYRSFCIALEDSDKAKSYITFGQRSTVSDIIDILDDELDGSDKVICGMSFFQEEDQQSLDKLIKGWRRKIESEDR